MAYYIRTLSLCFYVNLPLTSVHLPTRWSDTLARLGTITSVPNTIVMWGSVNHSAWAEESSFLILSWLLTGPDLPPACCFCLRGNSYPVRRRYVCLMWKQSYLGLSGPGLSFLGHETLLSHGFEAYNSLCHGYALKFKNKYRRALSYWNGAQNHCLRESANEQYCPSHFHLRHRNVPVLTVLCWALFQSHKDTLLRTLLNWSTCNCKVGFTSK